MTRRNDPLETRLARVERELEGVKATLAKEAPTPWWQQIAGAFKDDPAFDEITRLGAEIREADREEAR